MLFHARERKRLSSKSKVNECSISNALSSSKCEKTKWTCQQRRKTHGGPGGHVYVYLLHSLSISLSFSFSLYLSLFLYRMLYSVLNIRKLNVYLADPTLAGPCIVYVRETFQILNLDPATQQPPTIPMDIIRYCQQAADMWGGGTRARVNILTLVRANIELYHIEEILLRNHEKKSFLHFEKKIFFNKGIK